MPIMDGFQVLRKIRTTSTVPIIMLTARGEVSDRIVGLELGADDYLSKPFEPRELLARIQSVFRRVLTQSFRGMLQRIATLEALNLFQHFLYNRKPLSNLQTRLVFMHRSDARTFCGMNTCSK